MANLSYYRLQIQNFLGYYHPDKVNDISLIASRSELAEIEFESASKEGCSIIECQERANNVLFRGLHYSLFNKIQDIIEVHFASIENLSPNHLYNNFKTSIESEYALNDEFSGSLEEQKMEIQLIDFIDSYIKRNGIQ